MLSTTADVVLVFSERDKDIRQMPLDHRIPMERHAEQVVDYREAQADWAGLCEIEEHVNIPSAPIAVLRKLLDVEGAVEKKRSSIATFSATYSRLRGSAARIGDNLTCPTCWVPVVVVN